LRSLNNFPHKEARRKQEEKEDERQKTLCIKIVYGSSSIPNIMLGCVRSVSQKCLHVYWSNWSWLLDIITPIYKKYARYIKR